MKLKTKILIVTVIALFAVIIGATNVKAAEITEEYLQNMLDVLPESMDINLKESEYEKASAEIEKQVKAIWQEKGINTTGVETYFGTNPLYLCLENDNFHKANVTVQLKENGKNTELHKEITIKYNNTKDYNSADEQTVKNLKLESPVYFEFSLEDAMASEKYDAWTELFNLAEKYYNSIVKDKSITIKATSGAGDGYGFGAVDGEGGTHLGIFKNDILYDIRVMGSEGSVPVVTVPSSVAEDEVNTYVVNKVKDYAMAHQNDIGEWNLEYEPGYEVIDISLIKTNEIDNYHGKKVAVDNAYELHFTHKNGKFSDDGFVIVRREQPKQSPVTDTDTDTNIQLETNTDIVPSDTVLEIKPIDKKNITVLEDSVNNFVAYDITLKSNGVEVQPSGKVKIKIPIPAEFDTSKLVAYRIDGNNKIKYDVTVETIDGKKYAVFETDHFSTYILAETKETSTNNKGELDETPKTGTTDIIKYIVPVTIMSAIGIIALRKRK